ncbi:MAG: HAMP domain-containing histidine kinase, partial [Hymenobacter sp.]
VRYYPIVLLVIVALFIVISLALIFTQNKSTQNQVWAGMAKETAHQMGTPLTSLQGWVELLKDMPGNEKLVVEMEKDVDRLKLVSDRFGKIGSTPQLVATNLTEQIRQMQEYIRRRASGRVEITFDKPTENVTALISPPLFDWVLENLMKNALDAMEGKGKLSVTLTETTSSSIVDVTDTGKGIPAANLKKVFSPGFTTKKRGWGLGLTLCKRIIEQYHRGQLFVKSSEPGKGTTFRIVINK